MKVPKDINELVADLAEEYAALKKDPRRLVMSRELGNLAGKMIAGARAKWEADMALGEVPNVPFLGESSGVPLPPLPLRRLVDRKSS